MNARATLGIPLHPVKLSLGRQQEVGAAKPGEHYAALRDNSIALNSDSVYHCFGSLGLSETPSATVFHL